MRNNYWLDYKATKERERAIASNWFEYEEYELTPEEMARLYGVLFSPKQPSQLTIY